MKHPVVYSKINDDLGMIPMLGICRRNYQSDESSSCQNLQFVPNTYDRNEMERGGKEIQY